MSEIWRVRETNEIFTKEWMVYDSKGKLRVATIIVQNGSFELIEAIKKAWDETEGKKLK